MRTSTLFIVLFFWIIGINSALAQANIQPEPNILLPDSQDWRISLGEVNGGDQSQARHVTSILELCATRSGNWPATLRDACNTLLLEAIATESARLSALSQVRRNLGEKQASFRSQHVQQTLENQARQGNIVFWLVVAVVLIGILSAVLQFVKAHGSGQTEGSAEVAISSNEFKFRTTWLGALLLGMSMAFLALYLFFIYPVRVI